MTHPLVAEAVNKAAVAWVAVEGPAGPGGVVHGRGRRAVGGHRPG